MSVLMNTDRPNTNRHKRIVLKNNTMLITDLERNVLESYTLKSITLEQIQVLRMQKASFCLIKQNNRYWFSIVPSDFSLNGVLVNHLCSDCARCTAKSDIDGGCAKVRDLPFSAQNPNTPEKSLELSDRIEKYPFITMGIEIFGKGVKTDSLLVAKCSHFVKDAPREKKSRKEIESIMYDLYLFYKEGASEEEFRRNRLKRKGFSLPNNY